MHEAPSSELIALLDEELNFDPTTKDGFSNHLPMTLVAKAKLGADASELRRFAQQYSRRLVVPSDEDIELNASNWASAIGHRGATVGLRKYFHRVISEHGVDATLRTHLPFLLSGIGGAGFHGIIRLAYAIESRSTHQIASGIAYFAAVAQPLRALTNAEPVSLDPSEILLQISDTSPWRNPPQSRLIDEAMHVAANQDGFDAIANSLAVNQHTHEVLTRFAWRLYGSTYDFTALHCVTGMDATKVVRPFLLDQDLVDQYAFQALVAAYLSIGAPATSSDDDLDNFALSTSVDLDKLRSTAAFSDDEHQVKLTYNALTQYNENPDPLLLAIAHRTVFPSR